MAFRRLTTSVPRPLQPPATAGGGGRGWKLLVGVVTAVGIGTLLADIVWRPSKRNIELLAGVLFLGFVLAADPFKALMFTVVVLPLPAYTSVGATTNLLIFAVAGLVMVKSKQLQLPSPFIRRDIDLALAGFLLMAVLSFYKLPAVVLREGRFLFIGYVSAIVLYYMVIYLVNDPRRLWRLVTALQVVMVFEAALGLYQWFFPAKQLLPQFFSFSRIVAEAEDIRAGAVRVFGTFTGKEFYAEYLAFSCVLQYLLFRRSRSLNVKIFWAFSIVIVIGAMFATATRGGLFALILGFVYMTAVSKHIIPRGDLLKVVFVALAVFYLSLGLIDPLVSLMVDRIANTGGSDDTVYNRWGGMVEAFWAIAESPFLGHGTAIPVGTWHHGASKNIHCLYLHLAYTLGIPGLIAFMWFAITVYRLSWRTMKDPRVPSELRELALGFNVIMVIFFIDQIKIEFAKSSLHMHMAWLMLGLATACWKVCLPYRGMSVSRGSAM